MGGGNPLKRIEKEVKRSAGKVEAEVSRFNENILEPAFKSVGNLFGHWDSSPAPAPASEPEPEPIIMYEEEPEILGINRKKEMNGSSVRRNGYSEATGYSSSEGRIRVRETVSGIGKNNTSGTSGLGY